MDTDDEPTDAPAEDLTALSDSEVEARARQRFNRLRIADGRALHGARGAGRYLIEHKSRVPHGGWLNWLRDHFPKSEDLAAEAMRIAEHWPVIAGWLPQAPGLTKTAALRRLREHLRLKPHPGADPAADAADPLAAGGDLKAVTRRHRSELGSAVRKEVGQFPARAALAIGALPGLRRHLLAQVGQVGTDLEAVVDFLGLVLERVRRQARGEPEFQAECDAVLPRPEWCADCRSGACSCHTAESCDELVRAAAGSVKGPLTPVQRLALDELVRLYDARLRPAERELLDGLRADAHQLPPGADDVAPDEQPHEGSLAP